MQLQARVLKVEVKKNQAFDEQTGNSDPSYFLEALVLDTDTNQVYRCSFKDAPEAKLLRQAYQEKWPEDKRDALAAQVEATAKQDLPQNQEITLTVYDIHTSGDFTTLLVRRA